MFISGEIPNDLLEKIKKHPARGHKTLSKFYEYIFEAFLDSPESKLAISEEQVRSLEGNRSFWKTLYEKEKAKTSDRTVQDQEAHVRARASTEAEASEPHLDATPAPMAVAMPSNGSQELEGDFEVVLEDGDTVDTGSKSFVDLTLRVRGSDADGRSFVDRVMDFPWTSRRADFCKRAFGLQPADSLGKKLSEVVGRKVLVRRTRKPGPDGLPRVTTYYHPLPWDSKE